jgi:hypothetical protein
MRLSQKTIIDAWYDAQDFVKTTFANSDPERHSPLKVNPQTVDITRNTIGFALEPPATFSVYDLGIYAFQKIELQAPTFPAAYEVLLPIRFSVLQLQGLYRFYQAGLEKEHPLTDVTGRVRETVENSTLVFHAQVDDSELTLAWVSIGDPVKIEVDPDLEIPSSFWWTPRESERYSGVEKARALVPTTMPGQFVAESVSKPLIAALKQKLGV